MLLSIGIIVKNEEAILDKCLSALLPVLNQIDSELIIVDTGSTDSTIQIAKRYTNKIYDFAWCDDFSAARNETLRHATGEWYMYLDADEILKTPNELIGFFKSDDLGKYNSAIYTILNYQKKEEDTYSISTPARIFRRDEGMKFTGKIHEALPTKEPVMFLKNVVFDHFGYVSDDESGIIKKIQRNISLLNQEIEAGDNSPRTMMHIADCFIALKDFENSVFYLKSGINQAKKSNDKHYIYALYANLFDVYVGQEMYHKIVDEADDYFNKEEVVGTDVDVYHLLSKAHFNLYSFEKTVCYADKYKKLSRDIKNETLFSYDLFLRSPKYLDDFFEIESNLMVLFSQIKLKKSAVDKKILSGCNIGLIKKHGLQDIYIKACLELMKATNNYSVVKKLFDDFCMDCRKDLISEVEKFSNENVFEKYELFESIVSNCSKFSSDVYVRLLNIRLADYKKRNGIDITLSKVLNDDFVIDESLSDYIYYVVKYNLHIDLISSKVSFSKLDVMVSGLIKKYVDFSKYISGYNFVESDSLKYVGLSIELLYKCLEKMNFAEGVSVTNVYETFLYFVGVYMDNIYMSYDIKDLSIALPESVNFGYMCMIAESSLQNGDKSLYIKQVKQILAEYTNMSAFVKTLLDKLTATQNSEPVSEFEQLVASVKKNISMLISNNQHAQARLILDEYIKINPSDPDIKIFNDNLCK